MRTLIKNRLGSLESWRGRKGSEGAGEMNGEASGEWEDVSRERGEKVNLSDR